MLEVLVYMYMMHLQASEHLGRCQRSMFQDPRASDMIGKVG